MPSRCTCSDTSCHAKPGTSNVVQDKTSYDSYLDSFFFIKGGVHMISQFQQEHVIVE